MNWYKQPLSLSNREVCTLILLVKFTCHLTTFLSICQYHLEKELDKNILKIIFADAMIGRIQ